MKRVLVVINKLLLRVGLESLLAGEQDLHVKSIQFKNETALAEEIQRFAPDVVLVDENVGLLNNANILGKLLDFPNIRVLIVYSRENRMQKIEKREITISESLDFINAIQN